MALSDQEVKDIANKAAGNVMERKGGAICDCLDWFLVAMTAAEALEHNATVSDMAKGLHEALKETIPEEQLEDLEFKHTLLQGYLTENFAEMALSGSLGSIRDKCEVDITGVKELVGKGFDAIRKRDPIIAAESFTKVKVELMKLAGEVCAKEESNPGRVRFDRTEVPFRAKPTRADVEVIIHGGDGTPYSVEVVHKKTGETVADMEWGETGVDAEEVLDYLETIDLLAGGGNPGNPGRYKTITVDKTFKVDRGIADLVTRLNKAGYKTADSCSGMREDHPRGPRVLQGYLSFEKKDLTAEQQEKIKRAATSVGLEVRESPPDWKEYVGGTYRGKASLAIYTPENENGQLLHKFEQALLSGTG